MWLRPKPVTRWCCHSSAAVDPGGRLQVSLDELDEVVVEVQERVRPRPPQQPEAERAGVEVDRAIELRDRDGDVLEIHSGETDYNRRLHEK